MKHSCITLIGILLCLAAPALSAQEYVATPVKVSTEKVRLNGKIYLSHPVQERQTVFGIARAYGVTEDELYEANPELKEKGLQMNTTILIPFVEGRTAAQPQVQPARQTQPKAQSSSQPQAQQQAYKEHTVMWYEDLEDIAAEYGVTPQEIMEANGMKTRKITKRQVLRIPVKGTASATPATPARTEPARTEPQAQPKKEEKTVAPPEIPTLSDPVIADPELVDAGTYKPVKVDKLKVEKAETLPPEIPTIGDPVITDPELGVAVEFKPLDTGLSVDPAKVAEVDDEAGLYDWFAGKGTVRMALLMPFNAAGKSSETNMDFYSGVLMALHDLEAEGIKATLNVYDLQAGVPSSFELSQNDFILGPVTEKDLTTILENTAGRTPVVSPLDQRAAALADTYGGFIQAPASAASQYDDLAAWAAGEARNGDKVILVTEKVTGSPVAAAGIQSALTGAGVDFESVSWTVAEGRTLPSALTTRLTKSGVNRIIVASEKEAFVGDAVRNLGILLGKGYKIEMYAPSRVRTFDTVDGSAYHQARLHISSPYFADYDAPKVKSFVRTYRALYRTEPSQFAFQGYDITRYFASLFAQFGRRWGTAIKRVEGTGLHTDFRFEALPNGSFRNTGIRRVIYETDYSTNLAR